MSFTLIQQATPRLHRFELAVPGNPSLFEKAAKSRRRHHLPRRGWRPTTRSRRASNIIQGLNEIDWGSKTMMIRINGLDTHYAYRDVVDHVETRQASTTSTTSRYS